MQQSVVLKAVTVSELQQIWWLYNLWLQKRDHLVQNHSLHCMMDGIFWRIESQFLVESKAVFSRIYSEIEMTVAQDSVLHE